MLLPLMPPRGRLVSFARGRMVSFTRGRLVSFSLPPSPLQHNARTACVMQTSQPNAEAARLAKLNVPQLREELGKQGLAKGGTKAELVQRLLAQPGESSAPPTCTSITALATVNSLSNFLRSLI